MGQFISMHPTYIFQECYSPQQIRSTDDINDSVSDLRHTATYSWKARILPKLIIPSASNVEQVSGTSSERPEKNNPYQLIHFRAISNLRLTRMSSMKPYKKKKCCNNCLYKTTAKRYFFMEAFFLH